MAASTTHLPVNGTHKPWVYFPTRLEETLHTMSKYHGHHKSTTLFPETVSNIILTPRDDLINNKSCERVSSSEDKQKLLKPKLDKLPALSNSRHSSSVSPCNLPTKKKTLSLGKIPSYLKCFICRRIIKEDHFSEHLIFGPVKCQNCNIAYVDCQSFQMWTTENLFGSVSCNHVFNYIQSPVKYLYENLSISQSENILENTELMSVFKNYFHKLNSLQDRLPWKLAIEEFKNYIIMVNNVTLTEKEVIHTNANEHDITITKEINGAKAYDSCNDLGKIQCVWSNAVEDESPGVMLSQEYNLKQLEETTEFIEVHGNMFPKEPEDKKNKIEKKCTKPRKKKKKQTERVLEDEDNLEYLPVPSNGFYYVSLKAIENCPNCYEILCPSQFMVNINNFLLTYLCPTCKLTIYLTSPEVQVLTNGNEKIVPTPNKRKRGRPKKCESERRL